MKPGNVHERGRVRFRHFIENLTDQAKLPGIVHFTESRRHFPFERKLPQDGCAQ